MSNTTPLSTIKIEFILIVCADAGAINNNRISITFFTLIPNLAFPLRYSRNSLPVSAAAS